MNTPEGINGDPVITDYNGIPGRPGVRIDFGSDEYVIAQQLDNGFTFVWSTDKDAPEVMAGFTAMGTEGLSANFTTGDRGMNRSHGENIIPDLRLLGDVCSYAKLSKPGNADYVVYNSRLLTQTSRNDVAIMGPFLGADETDRISAVRSAVEASATPAVLSRVDWILEQVVGTVTAEIAA